VKRFVTDNYARAQAILTEHRQRLVDIADALLARETLDAEQVKRLAAGLAMDQSPAAEGVPPGSVTTAPREAKPAKERPAGIVPPMPPRPLTQE
jgi:cell division protease FtsH